MTSLDWGAWIRDTFAGDTAHFHDPAWRRGISSTGPFAFAMVYLPHHLRSEQTGDRISIAPVHRAWAAQALSLADPGRPAFRRANVAPRDTGKSTWKFLLTPLWAAAHGHTSFIAAFGDTAGVAEEHLATFTHELQTNSLLRADYPTLCEPLVRDRGRTISDRRDMYRAASGFTFSARGMETQALGLKVGEHRPDFILLDDIEPGEERYSADSVRKRLATLQDTVLPLNDRARVELVGTVTRVDSIIHRLVKVARGQAAADDPDASWVHDDGWEPHYHAPIIVDEHGERASFWPERWTLEHLDAIAHTRSFAKNFANDPVGADGDYWTVEDFRVGDLSGATRTLLSVDPAVTSKDSSDYTGFAVVEWEPDPSRRTAGRCRVKRAWRAHATGDDVRSQVLAALARDPDIRVVLIETNQGGELWERVLRDIPARVRTVHQTVKKEVRAASVLNHYQLGHVLHAPGLAELQQEMAGFPRAPHDDLVDAAGSGIAYFLDAKPARPASTRQASYASG